MKQHITSQDLEMLTEKGRERLRNWWVGEKGWILMLEPEIPMSIGQMIEFLKEQYGALWPNNPGLFLFNQHKKIFQTGELCDNLWQAVVEVLNKE